MTNTRARDTFTDDQRSPHGRGSAGMTAPCGAVTLAGAAATSAPKTSRNRQRLAGAPIAFGSGMRGCR
jgi:hypothetical protein